jgi:hypothetical protein
MDAAFQFGLRRFGSGGLPFGAEVVPDVDDDGCSVLDLGERVAGLRWVTKRWTI